MTDTPGETEKTEQRPAVVGVSFRRGGKIYYFAPSGVRVSPGDFVLARTERGVDIGEVVTLKPQVGEEELDKPLKPLLRRATRDDLRREERLREREKEAAAICERKIAEHGLPMKLISADYTFDGQRLVFYFSAEGRVDFRALVKDLAATFHCRIELRQVGVRDEARMFGGLGPCGRPLCCAQWLRTFDPVGIKVAKDQGLSLNPAKISGICDRLMCCLRFEHEVYKELAARLPQVGEMVKSQGRMGKVTEVSLLRDRVTVVIEEGDITQTVQISAQDLRRARGYWLHVAGKTTAPGTRPSPVDRSVVMREPQRREPAATLTAEESQGQQEAPQGAEAAGQQGPAKRGRPSVGAEATQPMDFGEAGPSEGDSGCFRREGGSRTARMRGGTPPGEASSPAEPQVAGTSPPTSHRPRRRAWRRRRPRRGPAPTGETAAPPGRSGGGDEG